MSVESLHDNTLAPASRLTRILAPLHLPNNKLKRLEHILIITGAGLSPRTLEFFGEGFAVFGGDLTLFGTEVGLVAYDDDGDPVDGLYRVVRDCRSSGGWELLTRWLRILSRMTRAISKLCLLATE
jgi:hypothetical protein